MFNVETNKYEYIFIFLFFNKQYSNFLLNTNFKDIDTEKYISDFIIFFKKIISLNNEREVILYIKENYFKNIFLEKIINLHMLNIIDILKYEYINILIKNFYIENNVISITDSFKLFKIHMIEFFKKDNIEIKNIDISINIHNEFNKFYIKDANNFTKIINEYYELKFNNMKILFDVFIMTKEFRNYCKIFFIFMQNIITPNLQKSL